MAPIETLLREMDRLWKPLGSGKIELNVIGSGALMLQSGYERATKDGDVIEVRPLEEKVKKALLRLAGKESSLHHRLRIYLDIVLRGLPFLPQPSKFHAARRLVDLKHFQIRVMDVADIALSKLPRFNSNDQADIREMVERGLLKRDRLIERFKRAMDRFEMDARAEDLPKYVKNLHKVGRDFFALDATSIDLPDWMAQ